MQYMDLVTQMKSWPISINCSYMSTRSMFLFGDSV